MAKNTELNFCYNCMYRLAEGQMICPICGQDNSVFKNNDNALPAGTILNGKYIVGKVLGKGGFGITYLGYDLTLEITVAIKEYFPASLSTRSMSSLRVISVTGNSDNGFDIGCEKFQDEAKRLARFNSPNIVHVREYFRENGTAYIVMDYIQGKSLTEEMSENGGRLSYGRILSLFKPLIRELAELHKQNMIHRDIKPDNLRLTKNEFGNDKLILLDFGAARAFVSENITQDYSAIVTPGFSPAEQYSTSSRQGPYTDVYAICATMYTAITGNVPANAMDRTLNLMDLQPFRNFGIDVPAFVENAITHGMAVKSEDRTQNMDDLYKELFSEWNDDDEKELIYQAALKLAAAQTLTGYQQAINLFEQISGWKDADEQAEYCRKRSSGLLNEQIYCEAKEKMSLGTKAGCREALQLLSRIPDYKDAKHLADECRNDIGKSSINKVWIILAAAVCVTAGFLVFLFRNPDKTETVIVTPSVTETSDDVEYFMQIVDDGITNTKTALSNDTAVPTAADTPLPTNTIAYMDTPVSIIASMIEHAETEAAIPANTADPTSTDTPVPTNTAIPTSTDTPVPTDTSVPTSTDTPVPTDTSVPTSTDTPLPTDTSVPTSTDTPIPTDTAIPTSTDTPIPTDTSVPTSTDTPLPTDTSVPTSTDTPFPTKTAAPIKTNTAVPTITPVYTLNPEWAETMTAVVNYQLYSTMSPEESYAAGENAYLYGDYTNALKYLKPAAENGNAKAQFRLGYMYETGTGVTQSDQKAVEYYQKAADQGDSDSQFNLGAMYEDGRGADQSYEKALLYYKKSAEAGYANAQTAVGRFYYFGLGVKENFNEAVKWYRLAAGQNFVDAQYYLGEMYLSGQGVEQSYETAFEYFKKAADQGNDEALFSLGIMYHNGYYVERSVEKALEYYEKSAQLGNKIALYNIGWMYLFGVGVKQSNVTAAEYFRKSAEKGFVNAQFNLALMYENGDGVEQSYEKALEYYQMAAEQGSEEAAVEVENIKSKMNSK